MNILFVSGHPAQVHNFRNVRAELIKDGQKWLLEALQFENNVQQLEDASNKFNPAREIFEGIFDGCKEKEILPPFKNLNSMSSFLQGYITEGYIKTDEMMHPILASTFDLLLDVAQDGSHRKTDLLLHVKEYVKDTHNTNLYRALVYLIMDILLWFKEQVDNPPEAPQWAEAIGEVRESWGSLYVDLQGTLVQIKPKDPKTTIKAGDKVKIIKSSPNNKIVKVLNGIVTQFANDFKVLNN